MPAAKRPELTIRMDLDFWRREVRHEKQSIEYYRTTKPKPSWGFQGTKEGLRRTMVLHQDALAAAEERVKALQQELRSAKS